MGTPLSQGAMVQLVPTRSGTWVVIPLQDAPNSVSSDPTQRGGTAYDPSGSGAAQSDMVGVDALAASSSLVIANGGSWTPVFPPGTRLTNSKGYWDPMNGATVGRSSWVTGAHNASGNPEHPWAAQNATDIFAAAGTMTVALTKLYVYSVGSGTVSHAPATAGQGAYLRDANGRLWWYRHIFLACRVGQMLNPGAPVGRLVSWTNGGPHLHLGTSVGGIRGVLDAKPDR